MSQVRIETDVTVFLTSIEHWDEANPPFQEVVASAIYQAFRCFKADEFRQRLVDELECGGWTVASWASGAAQPHRFVQKAAVAAIARLVEELEETRRREHGRMVAFMRNIGSSSDDD